MSKSKEYDVTPALAVKWLEKNKKNRGISGARVERYARDMKAGAWEFNGEPLIFAGDMEQLLDGQHRLEAVKVAMTTVRMLVVCGIDAKTFKTVNSGGARTFADVLGMEGFSSPGNLAAASMHLFHYRKSGGRVFSQAAKLPTKDELFAIIKDESGLAESVAHVASQKTPFVTTSLLSACHHLFSKADRSDRAKADEFVAALKTGEGLGTPNPVYLLRERLMASRMTLAAKLDNRVVPYLVVRAWNAWKSKERIKRLSLPKGVNESPGGKARVTIPDIPAIL